MIVKSYETYVVQRLGVSEDNAALIVRAYLERIAPVPLADFGLFIDLLERLITSPLAEMAAEKGRDEIIQIPE